MSHQSEPRSDRGFAFAESPQASADAPFPPFTVSPREILVLAIALGVLYVAAIVYSQGVPARNDELYHFAQIELFRNGDFRVFARYLTTIPGYHALVALLLGISGATSLGAARTITALIGLVAAAAFHRLRRHTQPGSEALATAQFLVLPVLAPYFFLVYTDVLALALVLWATVATTRGRHALASLILCAAVLVRQSDVVWAGLLAALAAWPVFAERRFAEPKQLAALTVPYLAPVAVFVAFWIWNGSISLSHEESKLHPAFVFHADNVLLALAIAGLLFAPFAADSLRWQPLLPRERRARAIAFSAAIALVVLAAFWFGFRADHPYNAARPGYFIHNAIAKAAAMAPGRAVGAVLALAGTWVLLRTPLWPRAAFWLFPIAAFFLAAEWLVETRYLIVPFALWLAFREQRSKAAEYTALALWAALAVIIVAGTINGRWFP
jgi:alpha-1,2-glucosyltransferase